MIPILPFKLPSLRGIGLLLGGLGVLGLVIALLVARGEARHWQQRFKTEQAARLSDHQAWQRATWEATFKHVLNAERARRAQAAIDERTVDALSSDRTRAVAAYDRLRAQAEAYLGAAGNPDLSTSREATCRAVAGTGCSDIPALLKAAQDNTDQLLRWIEWGRAQAAVPSVAPLAGADATAGDARQ